ncbi:MAG: relaxase/mobilization nuclease domain-containing protein, partial [Firmicutes bacterium]|nr:relaxase/mobilization nuclease domain-containing protein [Bacillota bacterium]
MAYTKIMPIRTSSHLQKAFEYIENPDKTTEKVYVSSYLCDSRTAVEDFREIQRLARNGGNNYAQHIIQSFSTEDNITPEKALEIGEELIRRMFPEHQYVIAVHSDTEHIHVHTILNSINFYTHKKLRSNIGTVYKLRQVSDELCAENGLIVIDKTFKNIRKRMKDLINRSINEANSFYEFLELMQKRQYEIRYDEPLSFKLCGYDQYFRVDTLGTAYKDIAIHRRCVNHTEVENKRIQPYMKRFTPSTHKSRLKAKIDWGMRECKSFDELLEYLQKQGIEV